MAKLGPDRPTGAELTRAIGNRQQEIVARLSSLGRDELRGESRLSGWDRLTIACHLRYGARASRRMTIESSDGSPTSFYPQGRDHDRPRSLEPAAGESDGDVIASLKLESQRLQALWAGLDESRWQHQLHEPPDRPDLGSVSLWTLAMLRLTEVEVHGLDLDLDLSPWSPTFIDGALPMRLHWLPSRRSNNRITDQTIDGTWAVAATDGPTFIIRAQGAAVAVTEAAPGKIRPGDPGQAADVVLYGTSQQLLAFILGRLPLSELDIAGDHHLATRFLAAFPAP